MHTLRDTLEENQKNTNKRPKSSTRFPKQMPSYIVAFAVHETYDDIATAQQMICNKRSLQGSASSVSPALSSKTIITIDRNSTQKLVDVEFPEPKNEIKININEEDPEHDRNEDIRCESEIKDYLFVDGKGETAINDADSKMNIFKTNIKADVTKSISKVDTNDSENKDDFETIKIPKTNVSKLAKRKRLRQYKIKNVDFKYKKTLKKAEKASKHAAKFKETLYSNAMLVSRTSLPKSVPAKINIIDTTDSIISDDENNNNGSTPTTRKSFTSYSSQDTLKRQGSTSSSRNEGMGSIDTVSSVIKIPSKNKLPYKTEVINVSVAVAFNPDKGNDVVTKTSEPYRALYDRDLMSTETLVEPASLVTSESTSSDTSGNVQDNYLQRRNNHDDSDSTLKPKTTSDNTYVVGNSSEFDDSSIRSEETLAPNSETFMYAESLRPIYDNSDKSMKRPALLDTVINMGIFPEINPSTSSAVNFNKIFINSGKLIRNPAFKGDQTVENLIEPSKYILKKSFEADKEVSVLKNLNLPDESAIKAIINENEKIDSKLCSGEIGVYPESMTELWDRLVLVVDSAVKRLENSLTERIIAEIRKSLTAFENDKRITKEETLVTDLDKEKGEIVGYNEGMSVLQEKINADVDKILQCNLVGNQTIDNIMMKLSVEGPKTIIPETSSKSLQKIKRPKIFRDYFEVLKPPLVHSSIVEGKGDTITVSTAIPSEIDEVNSFDRVKSIFSGPLMFLRENMLVITSVPAFFVVLLFVYGLIVLVIKPW